jgi:Zn-dependent peptidase ImmA (M78 family)
MGEIKAAVGDFLQVAESDIDNAGELCGQLKKVYAEFTEPYAKRPPDEERNIAIIPPEIAPAMMLPFTAPLNKDTAAILDGLHHFINRCDEFTEPKEDMITEEEIKLVLDVAQKKFRIMDIAAFFEPLKIVRLNNSHVRCNCECGFSDGYGSRSSVIFVYNPGNIKTYDRVFIFAHELGHALHYSLTGGVDKIPDGFDKFNADYGVGELTLQEKQEHFADVVAFAVLNHKSLKRHIPFMMMPFRLPQFEKYIGEVTNRYIEKYTGIFYKPAAKKARRKASGDSESGVKINAAT